MKFKFFSVVPNELAQKSNDLGTLLLIIKVFTIFLLGGSYFSVFAVYRKDTVQSGALLVSLFRSPLFSSFSFNYCSTYEKTKTTTTTTTGSPLSRHGNNNSINSGRLVLQVGRKKVEFSLLFSLKMYSISHI